jgi:hypothetical protein
MSATLLRRPPKKASSPPPSPAPTTSTHKTQNDRAHLDGCEDGMALVCFRVAVTGCKMTVYWFLR